MCVSNPCSLSFSGSKVNLSGRKFEHVGAWSPVMWTGNRPERNERLRAAASSPVTPRSLSHPTPPRPRRRRAFSPGGAAVEVGVVPHERDALLRQAAEVLRHERGVVVDLRVPPAETAAEALSAHRHGVPGGEGGWAERGLTRRR